VGSDRDIADGKEIVLRVVVGIGVYFTCSNKYKRGIDVNGEFDVAVLVSVYLEFSFLFGGLVECFILFLFILHFLFDGLVHLTEPFGASENLGLGELKACHISNPYFVYLREEQLVGCLAFEVSWVIARQSFTLLLRLLQEYLKVIGFHKEDRSSHEL